MFEIELTERDIDIALGLETHLADGITNSQVLPPNYDAIRLDRNRDSRGGVAIIHKNDLKVTKVYESKTTEFIAAKVECQGRRPVILAAAYRPPSSTLQYAKSLCDDIKALVQKYSSNAIWIGGDFNLPDIDWDTLSTKSNQYLKEINTYFLDTLSHCNLDQVVNFPTRQKKHTRAAADKPTRPHT